jgi:hypothetical protein
LQESILMPSQKTVPVIRVGDWTFAGEGGEPREDPALSYNGVEFAAGYTLTSAALRQAALDLAELADRVAAAGW